jgi:hypothetical protein
MDFDSPVGRHPEKRCRRYAAFPVFCDERVIDTVNLARIL